MSTTVGRELMMANAPQLHGCVWHEDTLPITTPVPGTGGGGRRLGECLKAEPPNTEGSEVASAYVHPGLFPLSLWERAGVRETKRLPASAWHLA
jgi:hypothetical protein